MLLDKKEILETLKNVYDPEYPVSVVELGIVKEEDITINGDKALIQFTPTSPLCPMGGIIGIVIKYALEKKFGKEFEVKVKPGAHADEESLNNLLQDKKRFDETVNRLKESGLLDSCINFSQ
jgi:metal-sulfur cluster biosynthetic enzyme